MTNLNEELEMNEELELEISETTEKVARKKPLVEEKIIQINDNFRYIIHTDGGLMLQIKRKYDDGTEDFIDYGWYGDIRSMAMRFININTLESARDGSVDNMKQIVKMYDESRKFMESYVKDFKDHIKESKKG
jgi:hypothetical protein